MKADILSNILKNITTNTRMARQDMNQFFVNSDSTIDLTSTLNKETAQIIS